MTVYLDGTGITFNDGTRLTTGGTTYGGYNSDRNGVIWQYGSSGGASNPPGLSGSYSQPQTIYFPIAFPNTCWFVFGSNNWNANNITVAVYGWTNSYFIINRTTYASWFAVGY